ncbi:MAG: ABC transporter substrate-binding protein [bacterium]
MIQIVRRLGLPIGLIAAAGAVLLWADRGARHRGQGQGAGLMPIAILEHSSNPLLEETRQGVLAGLAERGFRAGDTISVALFNAEGDLATGNLIASKLAGGDYRLVVTLSTPMLQAMANANRSGRTTHVFAAVTSPVDAGVGIHSLDSLDKPAYLAGIGTAQPVDELLREMKRLQPALTRVGVVWNPAEVNSEVCTKRARATAAELNIELLEAPIEGTKDVREAAESLLTRGAQAFWTGGDATVNNAVDALIGVAARAGVPVFSNITGHTARGALLDLGASYFEVGAEAGRIAGDILAGNDAAKIPVRNFMPKRLVINRGALAGLRPPWQLDATVLAQAAEIIEADGRISRAAAPPTATPAALRSRPWAMRVVLYLQTAPADDAVEGIQDGMVASGLVAGRDYTLEVASAQGDLATLSSLLDRVNSDGTELLMTLSTPTLQTALQRVKRLPIVFTFVANPLLVGAGVSDTEHLPNVTGVYTVGPYRETVEIIRRDFPTWKRVGTLFTPGEINSVYNKDLFVSVCRDAGIAVETIAANSPGELADAALALAGRPIDAIVQISDNQSAGGFAAIARAGVRARKPVVGFTSASVAQGAAWALAVDFHQAGLDAAAKAVAVMRGTPPGQIPFTAPSRKQLVVSLPNARAMNVTLPKALIDQADQVLK